MSEPAAAEPETVFRPSEYSCALLHVLRQQESRLKGANVLDVGCGSGVVLAAAGSLGASRLCGIDIENGAVTTTERLLLGLAVGCAIEIHHGHLFEPVDGRRFDVITANLPHFPMPPASVAGRLPSWSCGGDDGKALLGPFIADLDRHLDRNGMAIVTHNAFVDLPDTERSLDRQGLVAKVAATTLVHLPPAKLACISPAILERETGKSVHMFGNHAFGDMHVLLITRASTAGTER